MRWPRAAVVVALAVLALAPTTVADATGPSWAPVFDSVATPASMNGVVATGPGDVWSVGSSAGAGGLNVATAWHVQEGRTTVQTPTLPGLEGLATTFTAVSGSDTDLWVSGSYRILGLQYPIVAHYDGLGWSTRFVPLPPAVTGELTDVTVAAGQVWFAGTARDHGEFLLLRWDGAALRRVAVPGACTRTQFHTTVAAVLAASRLYLATQCADTTTVQVRAGATWSTALSLGAPDLLYDLAYDGVDRVWAVGGQYNSRQTTVWSGRGTLLPALTYVPPVDDARILLGIAARGRQVELVGQVAGLNTPVAASLTPAGLQFEDVLTPSGAQPMWRVAVDPTGDSYAVGPFPGGSFGTQHPYIWLRGG